MLAPATVNALSLYNFSALFLQHYNPSEVTLQFARLSSTYFLCLQLSESFEKVIATDVCDQQIKHARRRPNISYIVASASMNAAETEKSLGISEGSVDLITSAQAVHWFDLPSFYATAKHVLRPKVGVLAAWTYREPRVSAEVDAVCQEFYDETEPFWDSAVKKIVDDGYKHLPFPFSSCEESTTTGPFEFWGEQQMTYELFLSYLRSWSPYQTAKSKGVELIDSDRAARLLQAWGADTQSVKTIRFPIYLILGRNS
eukprot:TRINITY_DN926_c0_g1_i2.p1 TRINITY_DN926_c0_g1~~TRINITY_DN926_c0_g1_i2.p1  ORF type:complete len:257 (+),score=-13.67 TRINITY_DN926_c0_g1_i2:157-927(+)